MNTIDDYIEQSKNIKGFIMTSFFTLTEIIALIMVIAILLAGTFHSADEKPQNNTSFDDDSRFEENQTAID
jgi:hypothetical protein